MKIQRRILRITALTLICIPLSLLAVARSLPGYYVTVSGDSVRCSVDFKDWNQTPSSVDFYDGNSRKTFTAKEIRAFGVDDLCVYESHTFSYYSKTISSNDVGEFFSEDTASATGFLKVDVRGKYTLYEYVTPIRTVYLVDNGTGKINELVYRIRKVDNHIDEDLQFRDQLTDLAKEAGAGKNTERAIASAGYRKGALSDIIVLLNGQSGKSDTDFRKLVKSRPLELIVFAGLSRSSFPDAGFGSYGEQIHFGPYQGASYGIKGIYAFPGALNALRLGFQFNCSHYKSTATKSDSTHFYSSANYYYDLGYADTVTFTQTLVSPSIFLRYVFNDAGVVSFHVNVGVAYNVQIGGGQFTSVESYSSSGMSNGVPGTASGHQKHASRHLDKNFPQLMTGAGLTAGRHNIDFIFYPTTDLTPATGGQGTKFGVRTLCFTYGFNLLKPAAGSRKKA